MESAELPGAERLHHAAADAERTNRLVRRLVALAVALVTLVAVALVSSTFAPLEHNLTCQAAAYRAVINDLNARTEAAKNNTPAADYPVVALPPRC